MVDRKAAMVIRRQAGKERQGQRVRVATQEARRSLTADHSFEQHLFCPYTTGIRGIRVRAVNPASIKSLVDYSFTI